MDIKYSLIVRRHRRLQHSAALTLERESLLILLPQCVVLGATSPTFTYQLQVPFPLDPAYLVGLSIPFLPDRLPPYIDIMLGITSHLKKESLIKNAYTATINEKIVDVDEYVIRANKFEDSSNLKKAADERITLIL